MQPDKNISDLEYLSDLGFSKVAITENDIVDLKTKVRAKSYSYNSGAYFGFISLITGFFLGISVFFGVFNQPHIYSSYTKPEIKSNSGHKNVKETTIILDTINVVKENFVKPQPVVKIISDSLNTVAKNVNSDTIEVSALQIPELKTEKIKEEQIKYFTNSSIIYLHDLKITDYSLLYFKQNKFISLVSKAGIPAEYANKEEYNRTVNMLEPVKQYYLHQAIADAMLLFKNRNYNGCINALNKVAEYTGNDINCRFYYGMCYFYKKNYLEAIKNLDACITNPNNAFLQEAEYYKAMCLFEQGKKSEAEVLLQKIIEEGGFYSAKAKQVLGL